MSYIGNQPTQIAFLTDSFSGNASRTVFTMSVAPANTASVLVAIFGVLQDPSTYSVSGTTLTFSGAPPSGTGNVSVRYLGIPASGVTTTAYRTIAEFTATSGQVTFTPPSYTAGFITVFRNGVRLGSADVTASNGTTVTLATGAVSGDLITTESFYVSSVLNAIPNNAGSVSSSNIVSGAITSAKLGTITTIPTSGGNTATLPTATGTVMVSGNMPAFSAYPSTSQSIANSTNTKVVYGSEYFDTNNNFDSTTNYRFTPTVVGYYQITATVRDGTGLASGQLVSYIYKNGSSQNFNVSTFAGAVGTSSTCSSLIYLNGSTDYIEHYVSQNSGSALTIGASGASTYFQACLVRAA